MLAAISGLFIFTAIIFLFPEKYCHTWTRLSVFLFVPYKCWFQINFLFRHAKCFHVWLNQLFLFYFWTEKNVAIHVTFLATNKGTKWFVRQERNSFLMKPLTDVISFEVGVNWINKIYSDRITWRRFYEIS